MSTDREGRGADAPRPSHKSRKWRCLHGPEHQLHRDGESAAQAPGRRPGEPAGSQKDRCPSQSGDWRGRHCFALIFVSFGYRYFKQPLVLCVAKRGESSVKKQEKETVNGSLALKSPRVVVIPANTLKQTRKLRVAAYARVSSNSEDQLNSFAAQNAHYTELITSNPDWEFVDVYADKSISANKLLDEASAQKETPTEQLDLFTDYAAKEQQEQADAAAHTRERKIQEAMLGIKKKYGKNAILKGMNLEEGATARERNETIGGHHA